jgi:hypothetical protein
VLHLQVIKARGLGEGGGAGVGAPDRGARTEMPDSRQPAPAGAATAARVTCLALAANLVPALAAIQRDPREALSAE